MRKRLILIIAACFLLFSFKEKAKTVNNSWDLLTESKGRKTALMSMQYCYSGKTKNVRIALNYSLARRIIEGSLIYIVQKDFNEIKEIGTIKGGFIGDTLIADYHSKFEGNAGTLRQIIFLLKGTQLVEASGDQYEVNGKWVFINRNKIKFDGAVLKKIVCK